MTERTTHSQFRSEYRTSNHGSASTTRASTSSVQSLERDTPRRRTRVATAQELQRIIDAAAPHLQLALHIGMYAFELRVGSILAMTWDCIDAQVTTITIADHKTVGANNGLPQVIPIVPVLRTALKAAYKARNERCNRVVQYRGVGIEKCVTAIRRACERAGVDYGVQRGITFHTLRHTMNTLSAVEGFSPQVRKLLSGHKTLAMTEHYTHMAAAGKRKPLEQLARTWAAQLKSSQKSFPKSFPNP